MLYRMRGRRGANGLTALLVTAVVLSAAVARAAGPDTAQAFLQAVYRGDREAVAGYLADGVPADAQYEGMTALMTAAHSGHAAIAGQLMEAGAQADLVNVNGDTALTLAAKAGHNAVVEVLLDGGADVNHRNGWGWTALMLAAKEGHAALVRQLLRSGADPDVTGRYGSTARDLAKRGGHDAVLRILARSGSGTSAAQ